MGRRSPSAIVVLALAVLSFSALPATTVARGAGPAAGRHTWSDVNGDGYDDLVVGVPGATVNGKAGAGGIAILLGSPSGLKTKGARWITQDTAGVADRAEAGDHFGAAIEATDLDGDDAADLAIGAPGEDGPAGRDQGSVTILFGSPTGPRGSSRRPPLRGPSAGAQAGTALLAFDGLSAATGLRARDGVMELAIGMPGAGGSGQVWVASGTELDPDGAAVIPDQVIDFHKALGSGARAGSALAAAITASDGIEELVVGAPEASLVCGGVTQPGAGAAFAFPGRFDTAFGQPLYQGEYLPGNCEAGDHLGAALAMGDPDGDGHADLFLGVPGEDVGGVNDVGQVVRVPARTNGTGLDTGAADVLWLDRLYPGGTARAGDRFGAALQAIDHGRAALFDHATADLAVGIPGRRVGGHAGAGAVVVLYGRDPLGLDTAHPELWTQDSTDIDDTAEAGDAFGSTLSAGRFSDVLARSLVIGVPGEDAGSVRDAGAVEVIRTTDVGGLITTGDQRWRSDLLGLGRPARAKERFGAGLP